VKDVEIRKICLSLLQFLTYVPAISKPSSQKADKKKSSNVESYDLSGS
jgi:hypothetical protein